MREMTEREEHQAELTVLRDDIAQILWDEYLEGDTDEGDVLSAKKRAEHTANAILVVCSLNGLRKMR